MKLKLLALVTFTLSAAILTPVAAADCDCARRCLDDYNYNDPNAQETLNQCFDACKAANGDGGICSGTAG